MEDLTNQKTQTKHRLCDFVCVWKGGGGVFKLFQPPKHEHAQRVEKTKEKQRKIKGLFDYVFENKNNFYIFLFLFFSNMKKRFFSI